MLMKMCPRCRALIPHSNRYCEPCAAYANREAEANKAKRAERYNKKRDPRYVRFYGSKAWKLLRSKKLSAAGYLCECCKAKGITKVAEDVHHIIPLSAAWERRFDIDNLMAVCVSCHNKLDKRF